MACDAKTCATRGLGLLETARLMAEGVRRLAGTDLGLAVTGIAGPGGSPGDGLRPAVHHDDVRAPVRLEPQVRELGPMAHRVVDCLRCEVLQRNAP